MWSLAQVSAARDILKRMTFSILKDDHVREHLTGDKQNTPTGHCPPYTANNALEWKLMETFHESMMFNSGCRVAL